MTVVGSGSVGGGWGGVRGDGMSRGMGAGGG